MAEQLVASYGCCLNDRAFDGKIQTSLGTKFGSFNRLKTGLAHGQMLVNQELTYFESKILVSLKNFSFKKS